MDMKSLLTLAIIGIIAGFLASFIVGGGGLLRYLITGVLGSFIGGFIVQATGTKLKIVNPFVTQIVISTVGAVILVLLARLIR